MYILVEVSIFYSYITYGFDIAIELEIYHELNRTNKELWNNLSSSGLFPLRNWMVYSDNSVCLHMEGDSPHAMYKVLTRDPKGLMTCT